jgi:cytoskeletal protein CcmA (bactofilin family)
VVGNLAASTVEVEGEVQGEIVASECVRVGVRGVIEGDLKTSRLAIADGGYLKGRVEMSPSRPKLHAIAS